MYKKKGYSKYWLGKKLTEEHKKKIKQNTPKFWLGKHLTEEHKKKLSLQKIDKKMSKSARENMRKGQIGRKHSEETKRKISKAHKGRRNIAQSLRQKGSNSHLWKGGITPINLLIRASVEYKLWRKSVFERDNYTCIWCKVKGGYLNADHIKPFAYFPELRFAIDNGRTLCKVCHQKTDTYGKLADKYKSHA